MNDDTQELQCPACKSRDGFSITATTTVKVSGDDCLDVLDNENFEYDGNAPTSCDDCGESGSLNMFKVAPEGARDWRFILDLKVFDAEQLHAAALQHPDWDEDETLRLDDGSVDIHACLIMLLDPGSIPGCTVYLSDATDNLPEI